METEGGQMSRVRMLIVDDNENFRFLAVQAARVNNSIEIVGEASDGVEGITMAGSLQPDVILLDLHMPGMDGLEAIQGIRSMSPNSKILAWSGLDSSFGDDAMMLGAHDHMSKEETVSSVIDRAIALGNTPAEAGIEDDSWLGAYLLRSAADLRPSKSQTA